MKMLLLILSSIVGCNLFLIVSAQYKMTHIYDGRSGIVQLFEWKFKDIANECIFLSENGYGGVQTSPIQESVASDVSAWENRYAPVSYKIFSPSGTVDEFKDMVMKCYELKIRIYVDVVINQMTRGNNELVGTAKTTADPSKLQYPGVPYGPDEFNEFCLIKNYSNAFEVRNCRLEEMPDLNQSKESVQDKIAEYLNRLISYGVAGFRVDAVKHMWPMDLANIYKRLNDLNTDFGFVEGSKPFIYQEVIDLGGEAISKTEYSGLGVVTEFLFSNEIGMAFSSKKPLAGLLHWGPAKGFLPPNDAIVFVDNQDNQRGKGSATPWTLTFKDPKEYKMANAFMLAHPYGISRLMSSYEFQTFVQGPPTDNYNSIKTPEFTPEGLCKSPWVCEHRWLEIKEMIKFRNVVGNSSVGNWADNGQNQLAFCRGNLGFIAFNNELSLNFKAKLQACVPEGVYCDIITGGISAEGTCIGKQITVDGDGKAEIVLPFYPYEYTAEPAGIPVIAIHVESKL
ncbi:unnamed protein product [Diamesa hyperborea]